jgi:hypothetical protein
VPSTVNVLTHLNLVNIRPPWIPFNIITQSGIILLGSVTSMAYEFLTPLCGPHIPCFEHLNSFWQIMKITYKGPHCVNYVSPSISLCHIRPHTCIYVYIYVCARVCVPNKLVQALTLLCSTGVRCDPRLKPRPS